MKDILKCYEVLDLAPGAPATRVRESYVNLLRVWDPERYISNPVLRKKAEERRKEIEGAYQAIRAFLPELQGIERTESTFVRTDERPEERWPLRNTLLALVFITLLVVALAAMYLYLQGRARLAAAG